tara:strand:+ start:689 stop:862 length:174 start_codon:yes stop_codon:yes gene_type:complete
MRNKNLAHQKLENLDSTLINLSRMVNMSEPKQSFLEQIDRAKDLVQQLQDLVEQQQD